MGFSGISMSELLIILLIVMLLFGSKRLKTLGGDLGHAIRGFRCALEAKEATSDVRPPVVAAGTARHMPDGGGGPATSADD